MNVATTPLKPEEGIAPRVAAMLRTMPRMPIHWTPLSRRRARIVLTGALRVLGDSNQTLDIVAIEEIMGQVQLGHLLSSGTFETDEGRELLRDRPHLADSDLDRLRRLPAHTLGGAWARFLDEHDLSVETTKQPTPFTADDDRAFVLHRIRQSHDLWHVLLNLGTTGHEEVLVHAFSLAQTGLPSSVAIVLLGALKHMVGEKRWTCLHDDLPMAFSRGQRAQPLLAVYWERHLERPLEEVRSWLDLEPMPARA